MIPVSASDLGAMGIGEPRDENPPGIPCLQTSDGYVAFSTIVKGKWSAFGWCTNEPPDMQPCRIPFPPPPILCVLPARPSFEGVIRDQCVWEDFWAAHSFIDSSWPPVPPPVDFTNYIVIAVVLGERQQCGWEVTIQSIQLTDCGAIIRITECVQTESVQRRVNPYHFVKVARSCIPFNIRACFDHGGPIPIPEPEPEPIPPTP
jgi:hypothetical protein